MADVEHIARAGSCRKRRVVAEHLGIAVGGALLVVAVEGADRRVDIDDEWTLARPSAGR